MDIAPSGIPIADHRPIVVRRPAGEGRDSLALYLQQAWSRRSFVWQLSRLQQKAEHYDTAFGQLWNVLNPLLLAATYYLLFGVIRQSERGSAEFFSIITGGIFFYHFFRACLMSGATSLMRSQQLILNSSFPNIILPMSTVVNALLAFLPTVPVWMIIHLSLGRSLSWGVLWMPYIILLLLMGGAGFAMALSIATVYFRDTTGFLPYITRIWMYLCPVIYFVEDVPEHIAQWLRFNPMFFVFSALQAITTGGSPTAADLLVATAVAVATLLAGFFVFIRKESDVAVQF